VTPPPSPLHQRVVLRLARALQEHFGPPAEVFVSPIDAILHPDFPALQFPLSQLWQ